MVHQVNMNNISGYESTKLELAALKNNESIWVVIDDPKSPEHKDAFTELSFKVTKLSKKKYKVELNADENDVVTFEISGENKLYDTVLNYIVNEYNTTEDNVIASPTRTTKLWTEECF